MFRPPTLSPEWEEKLLAAGFQQTAGHDAGMRHHCQWEGPDFGLGLSYDRGHYDCQLSQWAEPPLSLPLLPLLALALGDAGPSRRALEAHGAWGCLPADRYVELVVAHHEALRRLFRERTAQTGQQAMDLWRQA